MKIRFNTNGVVVLAVYKLTVKTTVNKVNKPANQLPVKYATLLLGEKRLYIARLNAIIAIIKLTVLMIFPL